MYLNALKNSNSSALKFGQKVLIAEDDSVTRLLLKKGLSKKLGDSFEFVEATNVKEADKALHSGDKFDLVITDGHMGTSTPGISTVDADGVKVVQMANEEHFPVILHSSDDHLKPVVEDLKAPFVMKTGLLEDLASVVKKVLNICK
jgi:CheY-like chemotaxis protein